MSLKDYKNALDCLLRYFDLEPSNEIMVCKIKYYFRKINEKKELVISDNVMSRRLNEVVRLIGLSKNGNNVEDELLLGGNRGINFAFIRVNSEG